MCMFLPVTNKDVEAAHMYVHILFVELGGGVGDVLFWCRDGAYVEFGFR